MKTCVSSYSYSRLVRKGEMTLFDVIDKTKELGFDAIEFVDLCPPEGVDRLDFAKQIRAKCDEVGLPVASYTVGGNLLLEDQETEIERLKGQVDIAEILGAPVMRHDAAGGVPDWFDGIRTFDSVLPIIAKGCRAVTDYAEKKGIKTCTENHGFFAQDSDRVIRLIEAVGSKNYGTLVDMGNFSCADDRSDIACGKVAPVAFHCHCKDMFVKSGQMPNPGRGWFLSRGANYIRCTIVGHGDIPVQQCLAALKKGGYDGYCSIEFEGMEDVIEGISIGLENLKKYLANIGA